MYTDFSEKKIEVALQFFVEINVQNFYHPAQEHEINQKQNKISKEHKKIYDSSVAYCTGEFIEVTFAGG